MKKRILAILLCTVLSVSMITGCGSSDDGESTETAEEADAEEEDEDADEADESNDSDDACSDETFAALQEAYAYLTEEYNMVADYYSNNSDIPQDDDVEDILNSSKEYLEQMGEVEQSTITESDAEELGNSMTDVAEALAQLTDALGIMANSSDACSDETFAALQEAYAYLAEEYNMVTDYYNNNPNVPQNDDVEEILNSSKEYLEQMGDIEQSAITESDAEELGNSMTDVAEALAQLAQAL